MTIPKLIGHKGSLGICTLLWALLVFMPLPLAYSATPAQVDTSLAKARDWLFAHQQNGNWELVPARDPKAQVFDVAGAQWTGPTALATYALLCEGETPKEPHVAAAIDFLTKTESIGVYASGVRCLVWGAIDLDPRQREAAKRDVMFLLQSMRSQGDAKGLAFYQPIMKGADPLCLNPVSYDHSVSQFATLGLWSMAKKGFEVPNDYWRIVDDAWRRHQYIDGAWAYMFNGPQRYGLHTASMTAAGVATLFITDEMMHVGSECRGNVPDPSIAKGFEWMAANFAAVYDPAKERDPGTERYSLFGISRIGVASGYKYFGNIDWYQNGADFLLKTQAADGSWASSQNGLFPAQVDTPLGLLFLSYGSAPVALNKIEYALQDKGKPVLAHWNQRPQDALNFVTWMGHGIEQRLNYQIIRLSQSPVDELHEAPIVYLSGDQSLDLAQADMDKLRMFAEGGGLILGNADCGSESFSKSFEKLGHALFPAYNFRDLPPSHPILTNEQYKAAKWRAKSRVRGLSNGVRELMIIPQVDMSRAFQGRADSTKPEAYQLCADVLLYAVDQKGLQRKGKTYTITENTAIPALGTLKIGRLQVGDNWNPEPGGWRRMAALMHNDFKIGLTIVPVVPGEGKLADCKIAHLTGTTKFQLTDAARQEIRSFTAAGGTLVIDAAGGSAEFAASADKELQTLFGPEAAKAEALPANHALFTIPGAAIETIGYRRFARGQIVGTLKAPRIYGIEQNGRIVAYFSPQDLSGGLVGQPMDGIIGYEPESATALMRNIILLNSPTGSAPFIPPGAPTSIPPQASN